MNCPKCKSTNRKYLSYQRKIENRVMVIENKWECVKCAYKFYVLMPEQVVASV
jgi:hypothetical protein